MGDLVSGSFRNSFDSPCRPLRVRTWFLVGIVRFSKFAVFVSALALIFGVAISPVGAQRKPSIEENTEQLQKCVQSNGSLDILFLVDVSASLYRMDNKPGSDPDGLRVQALQAVTRLLGVTEGLDETNVATKKPTHDVNLAFLDFGERVRYSFQNKELQGWQSLSTFLRYDFKDDIFRRFKTARGDSDTDYVRALDPTSLKSKKVSQDEVGALQVLKKGNSPCRVLLWFTDGKFDIDKSAFNLLLEFVEKQRDSVAEYRTLIDKLMLIDESNKLDVYLYEQTAFN